MTELNPNQTARRSPLYRRHQALNAQFEMVGDALLVSKYGDTSMEPRLAISLGLADLSTLPRTGFKGPGAPQWAASQAVQLPEQPNTAVTQADGSMVAKLSHQELLIVSDVEANSSLVNRLDQQQLPAQTYALPRADRHSWLAAGPRNVFENMWCRPAYPQVCSGSDCPDICGQNQCCGCAP